MVKKAKYFNPETGEFEKIQFKKDLMVLEEYRYICTQVLATKEKLSRLIASIVAGTSYSSTEAENKINELHKRYAIISSKLDLALSSVGEIHSSMDKLQSGMLSQSILEKYVNVRRQIIEIEKAYGRIASIKAPELFTRLTGEVEDLAFRVKNVEKRLGKTADLMLSSKLKKTRGFLEEYERQMGVNRRGLE